MDFKSKKCKPCEGIGSAMAEVDVRQHLIVLPGWEYNAEDVCLVRAFSFADFYHTMAFVNAVAWIANAEDHHPDLEVGYNKCQVSLKTHALQGITENDFIVASKVAALFEDEAS